MCNIVSMVATSATVRLAFMPSERPRLEVTSIEVTLADVLDALGGGLLEVASAPCGLDVRVADAVIFDAADALRAEPGDVVLGVGAPAASAGAGQLVADAGRAGAAAVVFRRDENDPIALRAAAERAMVALVLVPATTGWSHLFTLLSTAIEARRAAAWSSHPGLAVGDLVSLANAVAGTVGGAITIEDPDANVLAFSSLGHPIDVPRQDTILGHRVPSPLLQILTDRGVFQRLYGSEDVVHVTNVGEPDVAARMAIAVRAGGEVLGSIWAAEADRPFDEEDAQALRGAARIAALHMLHQRAHVDLERQRQGEITRALLAGDQPSRPGLSSLGLVGTPVTVLAVDPDLVRTADAEVAMNRAASVITLYAEVYRRHATAVVVDDIIYVLLPTAADADRARLMSFANNVAQRAQTVTRAPVRVGIGTTVAELRDLHRSRDDADEVLRVLRSAGDYKAAHVDEVRGRMALLRLQDLAAHDPRLRTSKIYALIDHDRQRSTHYVATLRAYLDAFGDVSVASTELCIHRNTFRYRLERLLQLFDLNLEDPDERVITHLQLRFLDHAG